MDAYNALTKVNYYKTVRKIKHLMYQRCIQTVY